MRKVYTDYLRDEQRRRGQGAIAAARLMLMSRRFPTCALVLGLLCLTSATICVADPDKVAYELAERCGRRADELFRRDYGNGQFTGTDGSSNFSNYRNHYNRKLNTCFFEVTVTSAAKNTSGLTSSIDLIDLNENKGYGSFIRNVSTGNILLCIVGEDYCKSEEEWKARLKHFMEE